MIHGKMYEEATKTHCNVPLEDLITVLFPTLDGTILIIYTDTIEPTAEQEFCQVCEDASPPPEEDAGRST